MSGKLWLLLAALTELFVLTLAQNNAPVFTNLPATTSVDETLTSQTLLFDVDATDDDGDTLTMNIVSGNTDNNFFIDNSTGEVYLVNNPPALDADSGTTTYILSVEVTDGNETVQDNLTINVNQVEEVPSVVGLPATVEVNESVTTSTVIYSGVSASGPDPEGDSISYVCTFSPDDSNFVCDGSTGNVSNIDNPYYTSSTYDITVYITDSKITSAGKVLRVNIINTIDNPPYISLPNSTTVNEYLGSGYVVYQLQVRDPDDSTAVVSNVTIISVTPNTSPSPFTYDVASSQISLVQSLDYEVCTQYQVTMQACDTDGCTQGVLTVHVEDSLEVYWDPITIPENSKVPLSINPHWNVTDVGGATLTSWSLQSVSGSTQVTLDSNTGSLTLLSHLDYESPEFNGADPPEITLDVVVVDDTSRTATLAVNVTVTDVNEYSPVFDNEYYTGETTDSEVIPSVAYVHATDQDGGPWFGEVTYTLGEPGNKYFGVIKEDDGRGRLYTVTPVDRELLDDSQLIFYVLATDGGERYDTATVTITVNNVDEFDPVPEKTKFTFLVDANAPVGTSVGQVTVTDGDKGERMLYHSVSNTSAPFVLGYYDGKVVVTDQLDSGATYTFWAYGESCDQKHTESTCPEGSKQSSVFQIDVITFDGVSTIVNWEIQTTDTYFGADDVTQFVANLQATCTPCTPVVTSTTLNDNGNYVLGVYIIDGDNTEDGISYWSKTRVLKKYTTDKKVTPTAEAAAVAPSGQVVAVSEAYQTPPSNWMLDTAGGNVVLAGVCLVVFGGASTLAAYVYTKTVINPKHREYNTMS